MPAAMIHFLLVYDYAQDKLLREEVYLDAKEAADAYSKAEKDLHGREELEIVLVGSDSINTIHRTHGHYFKEGAQSRYLAGV